MYLFCTFFGLSNFVSIADVLILYFVLDLAFVALLVMGLVQESRKRVCHLRLVFSVIVQSMTVNTWKLTPLVP